VQSCTQFDSFDSKPTLFGAASTRENAPGEHNVCLSRQLEVKDTDDRQSKIFFGVTRAINPKDTKAVLCSAKLGSAAQHIGIIQ
jgi:hypothetical protein